jgi:hypothetical protein
MKVFHFGEDTSAPTKSAFCRLRQKICWSWFRDCFAYLVEQIRPIQARWQGMQVYAIDGQQLTLPRSEDLVAHGFNGRATGRYRESYMCKGYLSHLYDVLTGVSLKISLNPTLNEQADAYQLLVNVEPGNLILYDRLYMNQKLVRRHFELNLKFLMRCRKNANRAIEKFFESKKTTSSTQIGGKTVYLIKAKHPGANEWSVFATNLPRRLRTPKTIANLYRCRWEIESSFRELTDQSRTEQWHSKTFNGIMQELYAQFWLMNYTKANMRMAGDKPCQPEQKTYRKANFKLAYQFVVHYLGLGYDKISYLVAYLQTVIKRSTEKRRRFSRNYPRTIKSPASPYSYTAATWYWEVNSG